MAAFATSYIPTTTAAATRAADVAVMTGANFSNWYNAVNGTLFAESSTISIAAVRCIVEGADSSTFRDFSLVFDSTNGGRFNFTNRLASGNFDVISAGGTAAANTLYKLAGAMDSLSADLAHNGLLAGTKIAVTQRIPADRVFIGSRTGSTLFLNGHIKRIAYFPRRLANAELQGVTA